MATNNMHNLVTLIKRLEAATLRLEDMASSTIPPIGSQAVIEPASSAPSAPASTAVSTPAPAAAVPIPESVEKFDDFLNQTVQKYVKTSNLIGGLVAEQAASVLKGFAETRKFLLAASQSKKLDMNSVDFQEAIKPISEAIQATQEIKDKNRGSPFFNHLGMVADGIMLLAWITVQSRPDKLIDESLSSAEYLGNRVMQANKNTDPQHTEWVKTFYQIFKDLSEYAKDYYNNGIVWNPNGKPYKEVVQCLESGSAPSAPAASPAPSGGAPPPPPPPPGPPPVLKINEQKAEPAQPGGFSSVMSELNKGEAVTKGLKKVDKSQMTHKNPSLRAGSTVPDGPAARSKSPAPPGTKPPKPESMRAKKPAKKALEGNKWIIENYDAAAGNVEIEASISQSILISRCNEVVIVVKGKANAVNIDNCDKVSLIVDTLVSTVDVVRSKNFQLQVNETIPTVLLDQVEQATIWLSKESISTRVFQSKTDNVNIMVVDENDDSKELPLPSQICSYYDPEKKELISEIVSHCG
ncbi:hypothetical protein GE21DRAFT_6234 [Neurospora crassa]|uniref:Adenylyl cyclase-associated protein n=1 Tax=Neurospora crassa (strain ATCC 24698 / 74-OR23-1A / CBS 708.71 / DSM 1257 / FGSC 987) TaxID=367110 RepID=Q7SAN3_NEUCR|nr:adenylyl cyclase-associated protein [Neurospora crassa OR74A]EAA33442.3 adenylyl cyclase-associated protein [Neurospora crassa OR74A]KHE84425.1 hypothetical protein GE21DRAFT_6234 [Neurospora crassa]|eukprot:XP_962678.3 adenylyl cyclase-associated protein [Neurospora crassa OR74A]